MLISNKNGIRRIAFESLTHSELVYCREHRITSTTDLTPSQLYKIAEDVSCRFLERA